MWTARPGGAPCFHSRTFDGTIPAQIPALVEPAEDMLNFDAIAEARIQEALERGDFDQLPGAGRPLALDDDLLVPPEVRMANRVLKNAGMVPAEVAERREIAVLEAQLRQPVDEATRARAVGKLALLRARLGAQRSSVLSRHPGYARRIMDKLAGT